jgi:hypothetical protein
MKIKVHYHPIYCLLFIFMFFTSCKWQINTNLPKASDSEQKTIAEGQPKLIRTQGSNEYCSVSCGVQDKADNLWFGSTGGLCRFDPSKDKFVKITKEWSLGKVLISKI